MAVAVVQSTDFLIIVDNLAGRHAYRVDHFEVDTRLAVLRPVFDGGKRLRDFSSFTSFRLVNPNTSPTWLYDSAVRMLNGST